MKIRLLTLLISLFVLQSLSADDHKKKVEKEKAHYFEASFSKFHPGGNLRASEIIEEYWFPTDRNVGRLAIPFDLKAGEWDHVVFFYKPEGLTDFKQNPDKVSQEWKKDIIKRLGEEEFKMLGNADNVDIIKVPSGTLKPALAVTTPTTFTLSKLV